jgi:pimeloyl-ACP methyl ester carboxylesterase
MWKEHTIELGPGRSLFAIQAGQGPDLVLVHGALTTSHDWRHSPVADLTDQFRISIVDRPGHGLSRRPRFTGTPRDQARQMAEGLARLGVDRPVIAAHSFGALVTLALAEQMPDSVAAMVLVAPLAFPEPRVLEHLLIAPRATAVAGPLFSHFSGRAMLDRTLLPMIQKLMFSPAPVPARWSETYPTDLILSPESTVLEGEDSAAMLPFSPAGTIPMMGIRTPTRIVTGTADKVVEDERQAKALGRLLPNGEVTELKGAGHMLHHTHADEVAKAIRGVFAAREPASSRN